MDLGLSGWYERLQDELEDDWGRRGAAPLFSREMALFGRRFQLQGNDERLWEAAAGSRPLFTQAPVREGTAFAIQAVVAPEPVASGQPPEDLASRVCYTAEGRWLHIQAGPWGSAWIERGAGRARIVVAPQLADRPLLLARCLLNTAFLNLLIGAGFAMLHASCLTRQGRTLLLMAPHNTGKSTTAMHLVEAGYRLLTDSMVFVDGDGPELALCGMPVGRIKLRADTLRRFPQLDGLLEAEQVRNETKFGLELRSYLPAGVHEGPLRPKAVDLCLLRRWDSEASRLRPASSHDVGQAVIRNSLFADEERVWRRNIELLERLLGSARCHWLDLGRAPAALLDCLARLEAGEQS